MLRKDFTIDEYQIYEAKLLGASAVLLICSLLDKKTLSKFLNLASELKLDALVEAHDEEEVHTAPECGAKIIGVNNRNLKNFTVDVRNSLRLRALVPKDVSICLRERHKDKRGYKTACSISCKCRADR